MIYLSGAKSQAATPTFHNDVAAETAALLKADTFAIIDLRSFNTPLPPATEAIDPPSSMASTDNRRPAYVRQQSGHTSIRSQAASAEWYSSSLGKEARVDGSAGTVSVMGCSGYDWASKLRGAAAAISHFFITYYSVSPWLTL